MRYQLEFSKLEVKEVFTFLLIVKAHKYDVPKTPPEHGQFMLVDLDTHTVEYSDTKVDDVPMVVPTDDVFITAVHKSVDIEDRIAGAVAITQMGEMIKQGQDPLTKFLEKLSGAVSTTAEKRPYRKQDCESAEHIERTIELSGNTYTFRTCMACIQAAVDGDREALDMFMSNPIGIRGFLKEWMQQREEIKNLKQASLATKH